MTLSVLRFNFASPGGDPRRQREAWHAALELARWCDTRGVTAVSIDEHHATDHGWSANPVMAAAVFLTHTRSMLASIDCALGPLWDPVRMAEDIALVDTISDGRLHVTIGLGYRPEEYALLGKDFGSRGRLMDDLLGRMLEAWVGGVTPRPSTAPHPPLYVGGGVRATAERAARFGLPLNLPAYLPDVADHYTALIEAAGKPGFVLMPPAQPRGMVYLHEDPDRAWAELGEHIQWEAVVYGGYAGGRALSLMHLPGVQTLEQVRASGRYRFVTPDDLVRELTDQQSDEPLVLHPLVGAMPVDEAWRSVHLLTDHVLPALAAGNV